jgi:hypothetical protein
LNLKNKKENRLLPFGPHAPLLSPRPKPAWPNSRLRTCPARQHSTATDAHHRVDGMRRRRQHLAVRWPPRPTRSPTPSAPRPPPLLTLIPSLRPTAAVVQAERLSSATAPRKLLAEVGLSGQHSSPPVPPSSSEHHLLFAQPVLALARSGNAPILGNCSPEIGHAHRGKTAPWTAPFRFTSRPIFSRTSTPPCP